MPEKKILLSDQLGDVESFEALEKARSMSPEEVINEVKASGLRGRGGAGFPCGLKWELAHGAPEKEKYLICNADEGEVGTFKDRFLLQKNPYLLLEGMLITAHAMGAKKCIIYLREEYHDLSNDLQNAMDQCRDKGYLKDVEMVIQEGAGAYICGEESALMNSIEGKRGESRFRPPFPPQQGLFQKPTIINNVETLCNVPHIIQKGARWYSQMGTAHSKGTKLFCVSGDVKAPGVYELEMGCGLEEVLDLAGAQNVKWVQVGGSTGSVVPFGMTQKPLSYETVLGSGAIMVFDGSRDVVDFVYRTLEFLNEESCGKCTPCREGTEVMVEILGRLVSGDGTAQDLTVLENLGKVMKDSALCGLGQSAPIPVLDTLAYFRKDYEDRISQATLLRRLKAIKG